MTGDVFCSRLSVETISQPIFDTTSKAMALAAAILQREKLGQSLKSMML